MSGKNVPYLYWRVAAERLDVDGLAGQALRGSAGTAATTSTSSWRDAGVANSDDDRLADADEEQPQDDRRR